LPVTGFTGHTVLLRSAAVLMLRKVASECMCVEFVLQIKVSQTADDSGTLSKSALKETCFIPNVKRAEPKPERMPAKRSVLNDGDTQRLLT
jgi:hypothetical protein